MNFDRHQIPDEFRQFCSGLYNGSLEEVGDFDVWLAQAKKLLSADEQQVVKSYLDHLLGGDYSDKELQDIWLEADSDYGTSTEHYRLFLEMVRSAFLI